MIMWSLPTFLTFPFTLPSLPSISLPANVQRRFLSYVLKRTLGRFIKAGFDVERIQAQIGDGRVEIDGLQLDEAVSILSPVVSRLTSKRRSTDSSRLPYPYVFPRGPWPKSRLNYRSPTSGRGRCPLISTRSTSTLTWSVQPVRLYNNRSQASADQNFRNPHPLTSQVR